MGFGAARKDAGGHHREVVSDEKCGEADRGGCAGTQKKYREPQRFRCSRVVADEAGQRQADFGKQFQQRVHGNSCRSFAGNGEHRGYFGSIAAEFRLKV